MEPRLRLCSQKRVAGQGRTLRTPLNASEDAEVGEDTSLIRFKPARLVRVLAQRSMMLNRQSRVWISRHIPERNCRSFWIHSCLSIIIRALSLAIDFSPLLFINLTHLTLVCFVEIILFLKIFFFFFKWWSPVERLKSKGFKHKWDRGSEIECDSRVCNSLVVFNRVQLPENVCTNKSLFSIELVAFPRQRRDIYWPVDSEAILIYHTRIVLLMSLIYVVVHILRERMSMCITFAQGVEDSSLPLFKGL